MSKKTRLDIGLLDFAFQQCVFFEENHCCRNIIRRSTICLKSSQFIIAEDGFLFIVQVDCET